jgi:NAD+ diphosphatase
MRTPWPFGEPAVIDRVAERRATFDIDDAKAIVTFPGAVAMTDGHLAFVPARTRPEGTLAVFLGRYQDRDIVAVTAHSGEEDEADLSPTHLRDAMAALSKEPALAGELELAATAVGMIEWHQRSEWCGRCGAPTESQRGGWVRVCPEGHEHYPRTDPAVIVAIVDESDRMLLAHVAYHSQGRFSHLAGYVEPGESFEQAAHREVGEESSLHLEALDYVGSQPWPFPASIMVAFRARARADDLLIDDEEITEARWFTRDELLARLKDGTVRLASPGTIARELIHEWYGGDPVREANVGDG